MFLMKHVLYDLLFLDTIEPIETLHYSRYITFENRLTLNQPHTFWDILCAQQADSQLFNKNAEKIGFEF